MGNDTQHIIIRDQLDEEVYHIGYRWPTHDLIRRASGRAYHYRMAMSIHQDDIGEMFGPDLEQWATDLEQGSVEIFFIEASNGTDDA